MDKERFGRFIKSKRMERGWTQRELADRLYVDVTAVSQWERGTDRAGGVYGGGVGAADGQSGAPPVGLNGRCPNNRFTRPPVCPAAVLLTAFLDCKPPADVLCLL